MNYLVIRNGLIMLSVANVVIGVGNMLLSYLSDDSIGQVFGGGMIFIGLAGLAFVYAEDRRTK